MALANFGQAALRQMATAVKEAQDVSYPPEVCVDSATRGRPPEREHADLAAKGPPMCWDAGHGGTSVPECRSMASRFECIYCHRRSPTVEPSLAHIFPDALGGVTATTDRVCGPCNHAINQAIELPVIQEFAALRGLWGLRGRRGSSGRPQARIRFRGNEAGIATLEEGGRPPDVVVSEHLDAEGKRVIRVVGDRPAVEARRREIAEKRPDLGWKELPVVEGEPELETEVTWSAELGAPILRRLAAKIAFEHFSTLRPPETLLSSEFDAIRNFVVTGSEPPLCCGVIGDPALLSGILSVRVGWHASILRWSRSDRVLGGFVALFGLFHYAVVLAPNYCGVADFDDGLFEHVQARTVERPTFRSGLGIVPARPDELVRCYAASPRAIVRAAIDVSLLKFRQAATDDRTETSE